MERITTCKKCCKKIYKLCYAIFRHNLLTRLKLHKYCDFCVADFCVDVSQNSANVQL